MLSPGKRDVHCGFQKKKEVPGKKQSVNALGDSFVAFSMKWHFCVSSVWY